MSETYKVEGMNELAVKLAKLGGIGATMTPHVERAMLRVEADGKRNCPVDTGNLRNSIHNETLKSTPNEVEVATTTPVEYAPFVEYGTGRMQAQPFLRPAMDANESDMVDEIINAVRRECDRL